MGYLRLIRELLSAVLRHWFVAFGVFALVAAAAFAYAMRSEPLYQASAVISVESAALSDDLVASEAQRSTARHIELIKQRILSRSNLAQIVEEHELFDDDPDIGMAQRARIMRASIDMRDVTPTLPTYPGGAVEPSSLIITVTLGDPELAATVANQLVRNVLQRDLDARAARAEATLKFFETRTDALSQRISALDREMVAFKTNNSESLPEGLESRRDEVARLSEDSQALTREIMALERERAELTDPLLTQDAVPDDDLAAEVQRLRVELVQRRRSFDANHPVVRELESRIEELSAGMSETRERTVAHRASLIDRDLAVLQTQDAAITERLAALGVAIAAVPDVEVRLNALVRERSQLQDQLAATTQGLAEAQIRRQLETDQRTQRLSVLEEAVEPEYAITRGRKTLLAAGLVAAMLAALGAAILMDFLFPVLRNGAQMARLTGLAPVVEVPRARS